MVNLNYRAARRRGLGWGIFLSAMMLIVRHSCFGAVPETQSIQLAWSPSADAAGYTIYYGTTNTALTSQMNVGTNTMATIPGLTPGASYYFVVVAYDSSGLESVPSNEIFASLSVQLHMTMGMMRSSPVMLQFTAAAGHWYELQATPDLSTWTSIYQSSPMTTNAWIEYQDVSLDVPASQRFYRLVAH